jgi:acyl carrier protein
MPGLEETKVPAELRALVADVMDVEADSFDDEAHFMEDLGVDSLMAMEIMVALEKRYRVKFNEPELRRITCLRNVHELLLAKQGATPV